MKTLSNLGVHMLLLHEAPGPSGWPGQTQTCPRELQVQRGAETCTKQNTTVLHFKVDRRNSRDSERGQSLQWRITGLGASKQVWGRATCESQGAASSPRRSPAPDPGTMTIGRSGHPHLAPPSVPSPDLPAAFHASPREQPAARGPGTHLRAPESPACPAPGQGRRGFGSSSAARAPPGPSLPGQPARRRRPRRAPGPPGARGTWTRAHPKPPTGTRCGTRGFQGPNGTTGGRGATLKGGSVCRVERNLLDESPAAKGGSGDPGPASQRRGLGPTLHAAGAQSADSAPGHARRHRQFQCFHLGVGSFELVFAYGTRQKIYFRNFKNISKL
nr:heat shock factor-binding protein 1-like protein 1 isoform X1 [Equus asinus]